MSDYWQLFAIDTIAVLIWIMTMLFSWYSQEHSNWGISKAAVFFFCASWIISFGFLYLSYGNVVEKNTESFFYKISIENGIDNGYTRDYYQSTPEEQAQIQFDIAKADLKMGKLGAQYNFGSADKERSYFSLFLESMAHMYFTPLLFWFGLALCTYPLKSYLNYRLYEKGQKLDELRGDVYWAQQNLTKIKTIYKETQDEIEKNEAKIREKQTALTDLGKKLKDICSTKEYEEYETLQSNINLANNALSSTRSENQRLTDENLSLSSKNKSLKEENGKLKAENKRLERTNIELSRKNNEIKESKTLKDAKFAEEMEKLFGD